MTICSHSKGQTPTIPMSTKLVTKCSINIPVFKKKEDQFINPRPVYHSHIIYIRTEMLTTRFTETVKYENGLPIL